MLEHVCESLDVPIWDVIRDAERAESDAGVRVRCTLKGTDV